MIRILTLGSMTLAAWLGLSAAASAQVYVRAPFVRVSVDRGGVNVQAPFVNVGVAAPPQATFVPQPPVQVVPLPDKGPEILPVPQSPQTVVRPMTLAQFACLNFKCGTYEAVVINPCTCQPCLVRVCLPDCPRRVTTNKCEIVFHYGLLKKVRVHFDGAGPHVVSTVR
jgi:hypothetical protein